MLRTLLTTLVGCMAVIIMPVEGMAQRSLSPTAVRAIDSSLAILGMTRADCSMPADAYRADIHRTAFHDSLFTTPFIAVDRVDALETMMARRGSDEGQAFMRTVMGDLQLGPSTLHRYTTKLTADEVVARMGVDPGVRAGHVGSTLLYQYMNAYVQAHDAIAPAARRFAASDIVAELCDSLWMNSTESETASLWAAHALEVQTRQRAATFFVRAQPAQYNDVYTHGWSLYQHLLSMIELGDGVRDLMRDSVRTTTFETEYGRVAIGGPGNDIYEGTYAFILDVGGDDVYRMGNTDKAGALRHPVRCIIDLDGDDTYLGGDYDLGAGIGGIGILIDRTGDDVYRAGDFALGCGLFGFGIVHDMAGSDTYAAGQNVQGAGIFGIGLLFDNDGNDTYRAHAQAQGFGATRGFGLLHDQQGNDQYLAASPYVDVLRYEAHAVTFTQGAALGYRPLASGGIGLLIEQHGNDTYVCDIYGQGTAYWYGLGALADRHGEDRYQAHQYAQGSGVHLATGLLRDRQGDDVYVSHGVSQGCGHDIAVGILVDEAGNDAYSVESLSLGGGNANAVSIFVDERGNDAYIGMHQASTFGYSDFRRSAGMIGVFADAGGNDQYGTPSNNGTTTMKSTYGVFADLDLTTTADRTTTTPAETTYVAMPLARSADSLMVQASAAPLRFQHNVGPARDSLAAMGASALEVLSQYMGTSMPRERLTLENVLPRIYRTDTMAVRALLRDSLRSMAPTTIALSATIAGTIKDTTLRAVVAELADDRSWQTRRTGIHTLGDMNDTASLPVLIQGLDDDHPWVRARAAYHVGRLGGNRAFTLVRRALEESDQMVRMSAIEGLSRGALRQADPIIKWWRSIDDPAILRSGLRLVATVDTTEPNRIAVAEWLRTTPEWVRAQFYRTLPSMPGAWKTQAIAYRHDEPSAGLRPMLDALCTTPNVPVATATATTKEEKKKKRRATRVAKP